MDKKNKADAAPVQGASLVDPVYQKFARSVVRALGSSEFYRFFMDAIARADESFEDHVQSRRRVVRESDVVFRPAAKQGLHVVLGLQDEAIGLEGISVGPAGRVADSP